MRAELVQKRNDRDFLKQYDIRVHQITSRYRGVRDAASFLAVALTEEDYFTDEIEKARPGTTKAFLSRAGVLQTGGLIATFVSMPAKYLDPSLGDDLMAYSGVLVNQHNPGHPPSRAIGRLQAFAEMQADNYGLVRLRDTPRDSLKVFADLAKNALSLSPGLRDECFWRIRSANPRPGDHEVTREG